MPAGSIPPNPSELLVSPKMIKLLDKLKQAFDIVIIDGTPCDLVTDAVILSRIVDSTLIVTAHKVTKKDALERVIKNIQNVGGKLTGVVVNKIPISGKRYEKQYYYYGESSRIEPKKIEPIIERKQMVQEVKKAETPETVETVKLETKKTEIKEIVEKEPKKKTKKTNTKVAKTKKEEPEETIEEQPKEKQEEEIAKARTDHILKQMNEYLERENAKKQKGEEND